MDNINNLYYKLFICKDCSQSIKEYEESNENPKNILNFGYVQIYDNLTPNLILRTPPMVCIFGLNKKYWSINLQFTNYKNDKIMNGFLKLLENIDNLNKEYLGIDDDLYLNQIKYDKNEKYDPNIIIKLPKTKTGFNIDIINQNYDNMTIFNIQKYSKMICDIYIDKIWKFNDKFVCKWKAKRIEIL